MARLPGMLLAGVVLLCPVLASAAEEMPPAGTWKVSLPLAKDLREGPLWLVKLEEKDGKWKGAVLASAEGIVPANLENLSVTKDVMRFTLKLPEQALRFEIRMPKEKGGKMFGAVLMRKGVMPAELEPTTLTNLDSYELLKEALAKQATGIDALKTSLELLRMAAERKAKPEEVRAWAFLAARAAGAYGPQWQRDVVLAIAEVLGEQKGYEAVALTYARQADRQLEDKDRPARRKRALEVLAEALRKAGKADEAKEVQARLKKIDYKIKPEPFARRPGKSDRVVLVELFTGANHPGCVAADMAYDALGKTFKPGDVVRLQYHMNIPGPDPLTNSDDEARAEFYRRFLRSLPTLFVNGKVAAAGGGDASEGWDRYDEYLDTLRPLLDKPAGAKITAKATRKGGKISVAVTVGDVKEDGDKLRLRVALVEEQVDYTGSNKVPSYQNVVRAFAGGVEGEKIEKGKELSKTLTVDLDQVRKTLQAFLDKTNKETPSPNKERPLGLKKLRIVAFVQNDATREVLQAIQVDVPAE